MAEPDRIVLAPLELSEGLTPEALSAAAVAKECGLRVLATPLIGNPSLQYAVERELAHEGHDRESLGEDAFVERLRAAEMERRGAAEEALAEVGVAVELTASGLDEGIALAARTAFVRLYEEGLLTCAERVVGACSRCGTVVDSEDRAWADVDGARLVVSFASGEEGSAIDVVVTEPELLDGVVAVVVPEGHSAAGSTVRVPIAGRTVPVIADGASEAPAVVVPAHDEDALELSRLHGLLPIPVLDEEGVVHTDGPLDGLARYAARTASRDLLVGEGVLLSESAATERVARCADCGTVLIPLLGRHWMLAAGDLEVAAADAVREGAIEFHPVDARERLLSAADRNREWRVSTHVRRAPPIPASTCLDCGRRSVGVSESSDCNKCMGTLAADGEGLAARFVAAVWPLAAAGWPEEDPTSRSAVTELVVNETDLSGWLLHAAAIALRLSGVIPFASVTVTATRSDAAAQPAPH